MSTRPVSIASNISDKISEVAIAFPPKAAGFFNQNAIGSFLLHYPLSDALSKRGSSDRLRWL